MPEKSTSLPESIVVTVEWILLTPDNRPPLGVKHHLAFSDKKIRFGSRERDQNDEDWWNCIRCNIKATEEPHVVYFAKLLESPVK